MSAETKVDVRGLLRELPELLVIASTDPSSDRLIGVALRIRETESAVAELIAAASNLYGECPTPPDRNCSCHISPPCGDCVDYSGLREALSDMRAALARIGGAK